MYDMHIANARDALGAGEAHGERASGGCRRCRQRAASKHLLRRCPSSSATLPPTDMRIGPYDFVISCERKLNSLVLAFLLMKGPSVEATPR